MSTRKYRQSAATARPLRFMYVSGLASIVLASANRTFAMSASVGPMAKVS